MQFNFQRKRLNEMSEEKMLEELEKAAKHFNYIEFGRRDFDKIADISSGVVRKHFDGSWTKGLDALRKHLQQKGLTLSLVLMLPIEFIQIKTFLMKWKEFGKKLVNAHRGLNGKCQSQKFPTIAISNVLVVGLMLAPSLLSIKWARKFWLMILFCLREKIQKNS